MKKYLLLSLLAASSHALKTSLTVFGGYMGKHETKYVEISNRLNESMKSMQTEEEAEQGVEGVKDPESLNYHLDLLLKEPKEESVPAHLYGPGAEIAFESHSNKEGLFIEIDAIYLHPISAISKAEHKLEWVFEQKYIDTLQKQDAQTIAEFNTNQNYPKEEEENSTYKETIESNIRSRTSNTIVFCR